MFMLYFDSWDTLSQSTAQSSKCPPLITKSTSQIFLYIISHYLQISTNNVSSVDEQQAKNVMLATMELSKHRSITKSFSLQSLTLDVNKQIKLIEVMLYGPVSEATSQVRNSML